MTSQAIERHTIRIDEKTYRTLGPIQTFLASRQPGKVTIGEYGDASNPMANEFSLGDWRNGIGVNRGDVRDDLNRAWYATGQLRYRDAYILPRLPVTTAAGPASDVQQLIIFNSELYATYGTAVHVYDNSTDDWGASLRTLAAQATDAVVGLVGGTEMLVIANGTDVDYATDSSTWAENTGQAIKYLVFWGDLLWGITQAGVMYYTDDLTAAWSQDATLQLPDNSVRGLRVARGPDREQHIYAITNQGLYVHDSENARFLPTDLQLPEHIEGGKGSAVWRGNMYVSAGNAIYGFQAGADQTSVGVVGPDLDDGLPSDRRGSINRLLGSHNELLALASAASATGVSNVTTRVSRGFGAHHGVTVASTSGYSLILGWNERGWEVKWQSGASARALTAGVVGTVGTTYRLWWANDQRVYYMDLPVDVINPLQISTQAYDSGAVLETPWFDMGVHNQQKLALSAIVDTINPTTDETVKIEYATNYVESYTTVATKDETGEIEYRLPDERAKNGVPFRAWKWRITLSRGATNTNTPQLVRITLAWRQRIETLIGVRATLDLTEDVAGLPPIEQKRNLQASLNNGQLVEVSFRDDRDGAQTFMMDWLDLGSSEEGGQQTYGTMRVLLAEPLSTDNDLAHERV